ncbi:acyl carrier protein [Gammaproteobacteria bacterium]|nr:acyl carrier protein [Gammaproteobacteria bacterium]MDG2228504.1 acyl carrier protein [Gammaproteobacteria bacterium]|tara:strand:+ start:305 stop:547 length:243 start_codon:yes stop_codon:yes gene_type:complete
MENKEKLYHLISHVLGIDVTEINEETSPENTQSWDSFNALVMVTELEECFNVTFTMDEIESVRNVRDIIEVLSSYAISFD